MELKAFLKGDNSLTAAQKRTREVFFYLVFGVLTTVVNLISFAVFDFIFGGSHINRDILYAINNTVAWIVAVLFAFVTNRTIVFSSKGPFFKEMLSFFASRIVTLIVFELGTFELFKLLFENGFGLGMKSTAFAIGTFECPYLYIVKITNSVFVVIGNYVLSKLFVFRGAKSAIKKTDGECGKDA
jgi:putative flippase GtrA